MLKFISIWGNCWPIEQNVRPMGHFIGWVWCLQFQFACNYRINLNFDTGYCKFGLTCGFFATRSSFGFFFRFYQKLKNDVYPIIPQPPPTPLVLMNHQYFLVVDFWILTICELNAPYNTLFALSRIYWQYQSSKHPFKSVVWLLLWFPYGWIFMHQIFKFGTLH